MVYMRRSSVEREGLNTGGNSGRKILVFHAGWVIVSVLNRNRYLYIPRRHAGEHLKSSGGLVGASNISLLTLYSIYSFQNHSNQLNLYEYLQRIKL